jgi:hypothetical protein
MMGHLMRDQGFLRRGHGEKAGVAHDMRKMNLKLRAPSQASDTTRETDPSDPESSTSEGMRNFDHRKLAAAVQASVRREVNKGPGRSSRASEDVNMPKQAPKNSSPADFAAMWKVAATLGSWTPKQQTGYHAQDMPQQQTAQAPKATVSKRINVHEAICRSTVQNDDSCLKMAGLGYGVHGVQPQDIPLPKWVNKCGRAGAATSAGLVVKSAAHACRTEPVDNEDRDTESEGTSDDGKESVASAMSEGFLVADREGSPKTPKLLLEEDDFPQCTDSPVKIYVGDSDFKQRPLNPALPCKKRVPHWTLQ